MPRRFTDTTTRRRAPRDLPQDRRRRTEPSRTRSEGSRRPHERNASIDGFRALAVISVFLYHLKVGWLPSGHLGVVMFLVLTGYLVTSSLIRRQREGLRAVPGFIAGRLSRIWPPLALMVAGVTLACIGFNHVLLTKARPDILPGLGLFENISYILRDVSYFEQIGGPSPLTHLWYLGIDAQFCLLWAPVMLLLAAVLPSRSTVRRLCLVLAAASAVAMGVLFDPSAGITRVYYGTDTRAFAPLVGAWLAYVIPLGGRPARDLRQQVQRGRLAIEGAGIVSLLILVVGMVFLGDTSPILYRGGMFAAALLSALVLLTLALPGGILSAVLSLPPLAWLGSRSYGVYLWHYPLIQLLHASDGAAWWRVAIVALASLALAELSYRLVEQPIAKGTFLPSVVDQLSRGTASLATPAGIGAIVLALVLVGDGVGLAIVPEETLVPEDAIVSTGEAADKAMDLSKAKPGTSEADLPAAEAVLHASQEERDKGIYDPVLIGDSVPGDAAAFWQAACPDGLIDSYVGRRADQASVVLDEYLAQGVVGNVVIIQAFSNNVPTMDEIEHMIEACGDRQVYLVNVRIPESFETQINQLVEEAAKRHDNVKLIDWWHTSAGQDSWLYDDGEHLTPAGQPEYINMLVDAISEDFVDAGGSIVRRSEDSQGQGTGLSVVVDDTQKAATDESGEAEETEAMAAMSAPDISSDTASEEPLRILMLGNSFTYYNDLPDIIANMTGASVEAHTRGGAHLAEQLDSSSEIGEQTLSALDGGDWDYVVLQEQSALPIKKDTNEYRESVERLCELIYACGAKPVIYATWPYHDEASRLKKLGISRDEMGEELHDAFIKAANDSGAIVADVTQVYTDAEAYDQLYDDDGVHPSYLGSRVAAEIIAKAIEKDYLSGKA